MSIETEFDSICQKALLSDRVACSIGTLGERVLHRILKCFYEPDASCHEVKINGYVADILHDGEIIEIQTRNFAPLREKLPAYLPEYRVKVVYPIAYEKHIHWVDPDSGEVSKGHKSPKPGNIGDFLLELYKLRPILPLDGLTFELVWLDIDEFRMLTGRSRDRKRFGAYRQERVPTRLRRIESLKSPEDFLVYLSKLPESFTSTEFAKVVSLSVGVVNRALQTLVTIGAIKRVGKRGRAFLYARKEF